MAEVDELAVPYGVKLNDCLATVDNHLNGILQKATLSGLKGFALADHVYEKCGKTNFGFAPIENFLANNLPKASKATAGMVYTPKLSESKYDQVPNRVLKRYGVAPVICCNGIMQGTDKLGHFFQLGYYIFNDKFKRSHNTHVHPSVIAMEGVQYSVYRNTGYGQPAFDRDGWNDRRERLGFGLKFTSVYSKADINANNQGARFYQDLYAGIYGGTLKWYVHPDWDESVCSNKYHASVGQKIWENILTKRRWLFGLRQSGNRSGPSAPFDFSLSGGKLAAKTVRGATPGTLHNCALTLVKIGAEIGGITLTGDWTLGPDKGRFMLQSNSETEFRGTWGKNGSASDGGTCSMTRTAI